MNKIARLIFSRSKFVRNFYYMSHILLNKRKNKQIIRECERRKTMPLFNYQELAKEVDKGYFHPSGDLRLYGFICMLSAYVGKSIPFNMVCEHGFCFHDYLPDYFSSYRRVITFSDYRETFLKRKELDVIKIGPYIHYAQPLLSEEEFNKTKIEFGKVLLVMPFHSINGVIANYDQDEFIATIESFKPNYNTILVCLFWKDIALGRDQKYLEKGYKITTAGHIYDTFFIRRLRSIFEISDHMITNNVGTHIIYAYYFRIPIRLVYQSGCYEIEKGNENHENAIGYQKLVSELSEYEAMQQKLFSIFEKENLSEAENEYIYNLFGMGHLKSKEELLTLLY